MDDAAWLFDVYPHHRDSKLVVWVKHGERVRRRTVPYQPEFCVKAETQPLSVAEKLLADDPRVEATWRDESALWLRGPKQPVLRVRPRRLQEMHGIAVDLRRATQSKGFLFFDVDHQPESRWMHSQGLFTLCRLDPDALGADDTLRVLPGEDRWTLDYPTPPVKTLRLGVDVVKQGHTPEFSDPLDAIRVGHETIPVAAPGDPDDEKRALLDLARIIAREDPDAFLTRHGDRFDVPFLLRRIFRYKLPNQVQLGRAPDPFPDHPDQQGKSMHTYGRWLYKTAAYYLRGRWHIDLSKKTLDSEDDRKDLHGIVYLARASNRRVQDVNRNGAGYALQQMQIDHATDLGVALPWKRNLAEDWKDAATLCAVDRGGQIMNPQPGLYEDVAACDFSGYYPSLVVRHNLSSDTINCACCPDGPVIPELNYHVCTKVYGHQAEILRRLWPHRRYVKAILKRAKALGDLDPDQVDKCKAVKSEHKALGVVCFGYFRYRNARFGCAEVHQAIQCYGRAGMTRAREIAQVDGYEMVHTMTDCTFLHRPGVTRADALKIARKIGNEVGVPMDVEGVYKWVVFLPSKTHSTESDVGVPNRYYGKFEDGTLKVRGIEVQRHSTCDWVYDVQQAMLDVFHEADDAAGFKVRIPRALSIAKAASQRMRRREVSYRELGIMVQATRSVEEYNANTATKAALKKLRDVGIERRPGEYVKYVVHRKDGPWDARASPVELTEDEPDWFGTRSNPYSIEAYLRLLARSVETLLSPFGYTEDGLYAWFTGRSVGPKPMGLGRIDRAARPDWVHA